MPFRLANTPATFQAYINCALSNLLDICCIIYLDDILIFSNSKEEHIHHIQEVLINNFDLCWCCRFQRRPTPFSALPAQLITPRTVRLLPRPRPFPWQDRYRICPWPKRLWPQFSPRFPSHSILVNHPIITLGSPSYYCLFHQFCNCVANGFFGSEEVDRHWWQE